MKRVATALVAAGILLGACANSDRYNRAFGSAEVVNQADFIAALTTNPVEAHGGVLGAAKLGDALFVSLLGPLDGRLRVMRDGALVWLGPRLNKEHPTGHLAFDAKGDLLVAAGTRILQLDRRGPSTQQPAVVSDGWNNPNAFTIDGRGRLWVADAAAPGGKAFVARGRENNHAKRRRFATGLPAGSKPSSVTTVGDEVYVCRSQQRDVYRLHVGLDDVARRRGVVKGVKCDSAITSLRDGSLVTATAHDVRRYPAR